MQQTYRTILIDDEPPARQRLKDLLSKYNQLFQIIAEAENGNEAVSLVNTLRPDLIFLDIQMPGINGFEMLNQLTHKPIVIFCTAFDQYALQAFSASGMDYLLKPVLQERLDQAVEKLKYFTNNNRFDELIGMIAAMQSVTNRKMTSIAIKTGDKILFVRLEEIAYLEAKDKYVTLYTKTGKSHLIDQPLKQLEEKLPANFMRIHRAFVVNTDMLKEINKYFSSKYVIILSDHAQTRLISSRSYKDVILSLINEQV